VNNKYRAFDERVAAAQYLLQEAQQVPLRASQGNGWLSSLIVVPGNEEWWQNLKNRLVHGRRGVTASLAFQLLAAILAWIFTVSAAFKSSLGDGAQGLDISSGSTWIWLVRNSIHFFSVLANTPMATKWRQCALNTCRQNNCVGLEIFYFEVEAFVSLTFHRFPSSVGGSWSARNTFMALYNMI
jgi:hypothetical protein